MSAILLALLLLPYAHAKTPEPPAILLKSCEHLDDDSASVEAFEECNRKQSEAILRYREEVARYERATKTLPPPRIEWKPFSTADFLAADKLFRRARIHFLRCRYEACLADLQEMKKYLEEVKSSASLAKFCREAKDLERKIAELRAANPTFRAPASSCAHSQLRP